ncbi:Cupredoxin [Leptodontidium sp. 2 PMI_412]|nr:Cupredoxin [Leptodontidium sp. 2 PMI_412]
MVNTSISLLAAIAATAAAKTVVITAGSGGFVFSPDTVTADVGDTLEFHFVGSIHTSVQGDFNTPCQGSSSGFDSGSITSADVFQVKVQNTDPMWFFCATPTHCQGGMVGVVNPPSSGNSLATYKANAAGTSSSNSAGKVQGGVVVPVGSSGSSSSSSPSPSSTPPSSTPSSTPTTTPTSSSSPASSPASSSASGSAQSSAAGTKTSSSSAGTSSASGSPTSSASTTPSVVATGGAYSLMTSGQTFLLGVVFGLGAVAVIV